MGRCEDSYEPFFSSFFKQQTMRTTKQSTRRENYIIIMGISRTPSATSLPQQLQRMLSLIRFLHFWGVVALCHVFSNRLQWIFSLDELNENCMENLFKTRVSRNVYQTYNVWRRLNKNTSYVSSAISSCSDILEPAKKSDGDDHAKRPYSMNRFSLAFHFLLHNFFSISGIVAARKKKIKYFSRPECACQSRSNCNIAIHSWINRQIGRDALGRMSHFLHVILLKEFEKYRDKQQKG